MKYLLIKEAESFLYYFPCAADSILQLQAKEPFFANVLKITFLRHLTALPHSYLLCIYFSKEVYGTLLPDFSAFL